MACMNAALHTAMYVHHNQAKWGEAFWLLHAPGPPQGEPVTAVRVKGPNSQVLL